MTRLWPAARTAALPLKQKTTDMTTGYVSIILHAHVPYVPHPDAQRHVEETWFYESMIESYLPLLQVLRRVDESGFGGKITLSLSTPLIAMMSDRKLLQRFDDHLDMLIALAEREVERTRPDPDFAPIAGFYEGRLNSLRTFWREDLDRGLTEEFARLHEAGRIELMTTAGAHAILPLMHLASSRRAQVKNAIDYFELTFGHKPTGLWLPECAFTPPMDALLAEHDVRFTCVESAAIRKADSPPVFGNYAPIVTENGVAFFGRDELVRSQIWEPEGYPSDPLYREFDRDVVFELSDEDLGDYHADDPIASGLKYHRITGTVPLEDKLPYHPDRARERAWEHGRHFVNERIEQIRSTHDRMGTRPAHITCAFEAEVFGHWWFEGTTFLESVFFHAHSASGDFVLGTPLDYLAVEPIHQLATPNTSTWGTGGYFDMWLNGETAWLYRYLHNAEITMRELVDSNPDATGIVARALRQCGRELILAQASDWTFVLRNALSANYALTRIEDHLRNFQRLAESINKGSVDNAFLSELEARHALFPDHDWKSWAAAS